MVRRVIMCMKLPPSTVRAIMENANRTKQYIQHARIISELQEK